VRSDDDKELNDAHDQCDDRDADRDMTGKAAPRLKLGIGRQSIRSTVAEVSGLDKPLLRGTLALPAASVSPCLSKPGESQTHRRRKCFRDGRQPQ
jgi:hypothetical protein